MGDDDGDVNEMRMILLYQMQYPIHVSHWSVLTLNSSYNYRYYKTIHQ